MNNFKEGDWVKVRPTGRISGWNEYFIQDCEKKNWTFKVINILFENTVLLQTDHEKAKEFLFSGGPKYWSVVVTKSSLLLEKIPRYKFDIPDEVF